MQKSLRLETTVLPGHFLEVHAPDFPEGAKVDVTVVLASRQTSSRPSMLAYLNSLRPGPLLFKTPEDVNRYIEEERDSWER